MNSVVEGSKVVSYFVKTVGAELIMSGFTDVSKTL